MLQWLCTFQYATSFPSSIWISLCDLSLLSHLSTHCLPIPERTNICTLTSQTEQSPGKHTLTLNAPWPLHRFYKQYFSLRYQSVLSGSVLKKESWTLTNLFTLSWEEKNLKTSAFLSRGLIVNYAGKRKKERKHSEKEEKQSWNY